MKWTQESSSFKYNGTPVTRVRHYCSTPVGLFKVYEAVSGKIFIENPFIGKPPGLPGYDPDPDYELTSRPRIQMTSIEEGLIAQEGFWNKYKELINSI